MGNMKLLLDSGAHSLYKTQTLKEKKFDFSFYKTDAFWEYVDSYCNLIKQNINEFSMYVTVDVINNAELSWDVLKYIENTHKLSPLPVFHPGENLIWFKKYIDNYEYIGVGGLGQLATKGRWITNFGDPGFSMLCDVKGMPRNKLHGFAMTSPDLIIEYPWYSVDSTSWMQFGKYGFIIVPKFKRGKFIYEESPHIVAVSTRKTRKSEYDHFVNLPKIEQQHILEYLEMKGIPMGKSILQEVEFDKTKAELPVSSKEVSSKEIVVEVGVCNNNDLRDQINLDYYLDLEAEIPPWPRAWKRRGKMTTRLPV